MAATASYNFVSLPPRILPAEVRNESSVEKTVKAYCEHVASKGKLSGYIDLEITAKSPLFIGTEMGNCEFFAPAGKKIIPGSTLRGMAKNIMKIVTAGAMRCTKEDADFNDKQLYFRTMAGSGRIREAYVNELVINKRDSENHWYSETKATAGYLLHNEVEDRYYMCPTNFKRVNDPRRVREISGAILWDDAKNQGKVACFTGKMPFGRTAKKHYTVHGSLNLSKKEELPADVVEAYKNDITRDEKLDIFKLGLKGEKAREFAGEEYDFVCPCFYLKKDGVIKHFGFGQYYRIPYEKTIKDHVPAELQESTIDFTDMLFGKKEQWGSRLAFEDAEIQSEGEDVEAGEIKPLLEPKPTSFQLYLAQAQAQGGTAANWNDDVPIRGYKMYWHQAGADWRGHTDNENLRSVIRPVGKDANFRGKIRFERLSEVELGALAKVFALAVKDGELCYKVGKGKSLGLGSIRIEPSLVVYDEKENYSNLFMEGALNLASEEKGSEGILEYAQIFDAYLKEEFTERERARYDISQRELAAMLSWANTEKPEWKEKIRMMSIEDKDKPFQNRFILPTAMQVVR